MPTAELSKFRFHGHRLEYLHFERQEGAAEDGQYHLNIKFETNVELREVEQESADDNDEETSPPTMCSFVSLRVWIDWEPTPGPFAFELLVRGQFDHHPNMSPETFEKFSTVSGPSILFTHARPLVRNIMMEAGEQFRLPLLNIRDSIRKLETELQDE